MAAPATSFHNNGITKLPINKPGVQKLDTLLGLYTQAYNSNALVKQLFYLDLIFRPEKTTDGVNLQGTFIGGVIAGGANAAFHNTVRYSKNRLVKRNADGSTTTVILLNDAGLNTLGNSNTRMDFGDRVGNFFLSGDFKSAFYVDSSDVGFKWRNQNMNLIYTTVSLGAQAQRTTVTRTLTLRANKATGLRAGDIIFFKTYITNPEGTTESNPYSFLLKAKYITGAGFHDQYASYAYNYNMSKNIYVNSEDLEVGVKFWVDDSMSVDAQEGWYYFGTGYCFYYGFNSSAQRWEVTQQWDIGQGWPTGDPAAGGGSSYQGPTRYLYNGYSYSDKEGAANMALNNPMNAYLYRDDSTGRWYSSYQGAYPNFTFSGFVESAYYAQANGGSIAQMLFIDGTQYGTFVTYP